MTLRALPLACFLFASVGAEVHAAGAAEDAVIDDATVRVALERLIATGRGPGFAVAIVDARGPRLIVAGEAAAGVPVTETTQFEIGSMTKPLTATLIARLADRGVLTLDDPLSRWLPETRQRPEGIGPVTLRQLLTHTSGLPRIPHQREFFVSMARDPQDPYAAYGKDELLAYLGALARESSLPAGFAYSNLGYAVLGLVAERATGRSYAELLEEFVLRPAGIERAQFEATPALAAPHDARGRVVKPWHLRGFASAGAVRLDARDLLVLLDAAMHRRAPFLAEDFAAQAERPPGGGRSVALGWMRREVEGDTLIWHDGATGGFHSFIEFRDRRGVGVAALVNSTYEVDNLVLHLLDPSRPVDVPSRLDAIVWLLLVMAALFALTVISSGASIDTATQFGWRRFAGRLGQSSRAGVLAAVVWCAYAATALWVIGAVQGWPGWAWGFAAACVVIAVLAALRVWARLPWWPCGARRALRIGGLCFSALLGALMIAGTLLA